MFRTSAAQSSCLVYRAKRAVRWKWWSHPRSEGYASKMNTRCLITTIRRENLDVLLPHNGGGRIATATKCTGTCPFYLYTVQKRSRPRSAARHALSSSSTRAPPPAPRAPTSSLTDALVVAHGRSFGGACNCSSAVLTTRSTVPFGGADECLRVADQCPDARRRLMKRLTDDPAPSRPERSGAASPTVARGTACAARPKRTIAAPSPSRFLERSGELNTGSAYDQQECDGTRIQPAQSRNWPATRWLPVGRTFVHCRGRTRTADLRNDSAFAKIQNVSVHNRPREELRGHRPQSRLTPPHTPSPVVPLSAITTAARPEQRRKCLDCC